jgi:hypothetical protein
MDLSGPKLCLMLKVATPADIISSLGGFYGTANAIRPRAPGETLDSAGRIRRWRHRCVVPSFEALSWLLEESLERPNGVQVGGRFVQRLYGCNVHRWWCFSVDVFSPVSRSRRSFAYSWALKGGRCVGCAMRYKRLVYRLLTSWWARVQGESRCLVCVVGYVVSRVVLCLYRCSLLGVVQAILVFLL